MAASIQASVAGLALVEQARRKKGWTKKASTWRGDAGHLSTSTLDRFWARTPISQEYFVAICKAVGVDWEMIADLSPTTLPSITRTQFSAYNPQTFTGREAEIAQLTTLLRGSCRVLAITGMTGIGKTALAERVVANLMESSESTALPYIRFSLDDRSLSSDFAVSGAELLRTLDDEPTLADQQDAANLLAHILQRLYSHPCRLQIDSLEQLLKGNEQEGWSEFREKPWLNLLNRFLAGNDCPSQLVLTSQDIPGELDTVASHYPQFWHCQTLQGLNAEEQWELFRKLGVLTETEPTATELDYLKRIGAYYDGHPFALETIAGEITKDPKFQGNITQFWHHYEAEFTTTAAPTTNKLARSRLFRRRVQQRVEQTLQRLPNPAQQMLCACSVFRRPVPEVFWLAMVTEEPEIAFDTLQDRYLMQFIAVANNRFLVRQHNLIRSVAYNLLKADITTWHQAEWRSAELWLTKYEPEPDASNLETVLGKLEACNHYSEVNDWDAAKTILLDQQIGKQLQTWGHYQEILTYYHCLIGHLKQPDEVVCRKEIGIVYYSLSNFPLAITYLEQGLNIARNICNTLEEGAALGNLGLVYAGLGQYEQAVSFYHQQLIITRQIGDRRGESKSLGNLANTYNFRGDYERAVEFHRQALEIAMEIEDLQWQASCLGNLGIVYKNLGRYTEAIISYEKQLNITRKIGHRNGEGRALGSLGNAHECLGQYNQALKFHEQHLAIARDIGDLQGEGAALGNSGNSYYGLGQYEKAKNFYQQHLKIAQKIKDLSAESDALGNLGNIHHKLKEYQDAIDCHEKALCISRKIGYRLGEAHDLYNLGNAYLSLGQYSKAINYLEQSLVTSQKIGSRFGEGMTFLSLSVVQLKLKQYSNSLMYNQLALDIFREIRDRANEAEALKHLAELHQVLGKIEMAWQYCQQALTLATELNIPLAADCQIIMQELENGA